MRAFPIPALTSRSQTMAVHRLAGAPTAKNFFFIGLDKKLMAVSIDSSHGKLKAGVPYVLFQTRFIALRIVLFQYAVSPDGKRFLINSLPPGGAAPITVLIN
jgi:hypothetical protein